MTDFEPEHLLASSGPKKSLIEQPEVDQSQVSRPLIEEEQAPAPSPPARGPRRIKEGHPYVPRAHLPSPIRKDSFGSYFNPMNWFKWGKERSLARQAAKAIHDPQGNAGISLGEKHWSALNTTHGQRILKKQAKSSAKSDATGWNSKIEAFQRNQYRNRQWEQYGHQAVGSADAWRNGQGKTDSSLPMPEGRTFDDGLGYLYPQGDGFDWNGAKSMSRDEIAEAKSDAKYFAKSDRADRKAKRALAKRSPAPTFTSSGDMFDDIERLDPPKAAEDGSGSIEYIDETKFAQKNQHDSLNDDDDMEAPKPKLKDIQNMDQEEILKLALKMKFIKD